MRAPPSPASTLLLCLDMQPVFIRAVAGGSQVLRRCQFAVASAAGLGIPVAFTEQVPGRLGATDPALLSLVSEPEVHAKDSFSALPPGEENPGVVAGRGIKRLLVCGLETPVCVYQTAVDALGLGFDVTVLSDCVGARREADARTCLAALALAGAAILPAETVYYSILAGATHPFFRAYTELVKKYA
jgi:nicotinamidase-related amidase